MAVSQPESSDTEHEWGARRNPITSQASQKQRDFSSSDSDTDSDMSTESTSQNVTDLEEDDETDITGVAQHQNGSIATPRANACSLAHGFAKTTARKPEINCSSSSSNSARSSESENQYETSREEIAQSRGSSRKPSILGHQLERVFTEPESSTHTRRLMFLGNKLSELREAPSIPITQDTTPSTNVSDHDELENNVMAQGAQSDVMARNTKPNPKRQPLKPSQHTNTKKRQRSPLEEASNKALHVMNKKRRGQSPADQHKLTTSKEVNLSYSPNSRVLQSPLEAHVNQSVSVGGWQAIKPNDLSKTNPRPLASDNETEENEADDKQEEKTARQPCSSAKKVRDGKHKRYPHANSRARARANSDHKMTGRFSERETQEMERFKHGWCVQYQIDEHTFNDCINRRRKSGFPPDLDFTKNQMLDEFLDVLPNRDKRSMFRYKERRWQNVETTPYEWTSQQDQELKALFQEHGSRWITIADYLGRTQDDVAQRWRNHVANKDTIRMGSWSDEEIQELRDAVADALRYARDNPRVDQISWDSVSKNMGGSRTAQQCAGKWQKLMVSERKERWLADNNIVAPEGYQVKLVTVRKGYKRQGPQKTHASRPSIPSKRAHRNESELDIERPPEDSDEGIFVNEHPSDDLNGSASNGNDVKTNNDNVRPHATESTVLKSPLSKPQTAGQASSRKTTDTADSIRKRSLAHSAKASLMQNSISPRAPRSPRSSDHNRNSANKIPSLSLTSKSRPNGQSLYLEDAFTATSPAARPPTSQIQLREERPSPHIAMSRAPERKVSPRALSQTVADAAAETDNDVDTEDDSASSYSGENSGESSSDHSEESEDEEEFSEEAQERGLIVKDSRRNKVPTAYHNDGGEEDGLEGPWGRESKDEIEEQEEEDAEGKMGGNEGEEKEEEGKGEENLEIELANRVRDEQKVPTANSAIERTDTESSDSDISDGSEDESDTSEVLEASERDENINKDDSASAESQLATPKKPTKPTEPAKSNLKSPRQPLGSPPSYESIIQAQKLDGLLTDSSAHHRINHNPTPDRKGQPGQKQNVVDTSNGRPLMARHGQAFRGKRITSIPRALPGG